MSFFRKMRGTVTLCIYLVISLHVVINGKITCRDLDIQVKSISNTNELLRSQDSNDQFERVFLHFHYSIINQTLDLTSLSTNLSGTFYVEILSAQGFIVSKDASPFIIPPIIPMNQTQAALIFKNSAFFFYDSNRRPLGASCDGFLASYFGMDIGDLRSGRVNKSSLFEQLQASTFSMTVVGLILHEYVDLGQKLCPLIFKNFNMDSFTLSGLHKNMLSSHMLEFSDLEETFGETASSLDLNCWIAALWIRKIYRPELSSKLFNRHVFAKTNIIFISGVMGRISEDALFRSLEALNEIFFDAYNTREFFHYSNNKWLSEFHGCRHMDPQIWYSDDKTIIGPYLIKCIKLFMSDNLNDYSFPDEDFCLFKYLPPIVFTFPSNSRMGYEKTCLLVHVLQFLRSKNRDMVSGFLKFTINISQADYETCQIDRRLELCFNSSTSIKAVHQVLNLMDFAYVFKWTELVGPIVIFPIVSALGLVLNFISAVILTKKKYQTEIFKGERIYRIILLNCVFNSLECFFSLLSVYGQCIQYSSVFCPSAHDDALFHFIRVYSINYLMESFKTCSILTSLMFSVERYLSVADSKREIVKKYLKLKIKDFVSIISVFSFVSSIFKCFEDSSVTELYFNKAFVKNFYNYTDAWITIVRTVHYVINDFVLILFNFVIDLVLVVKIRKELSQKKQLTKKMVERFDSSKSTYRKKIDEIKKAHDDTNRLIIWALCLFMVCRLPELVFELHFLFLKPSDDMFSYNSICLSDGLCSILKDTTQFLYMFSYCVNIFLYCKFNKKFRQAFNDFFKNLGKHSQQ